MAAPEFRAITQLHDIKVFSRKVLTFHKSLCIVTLRSIAGRNGAYMARNITARVAAERAANIINTSTLTHLLERNEPAKPGGTGICAAFTAGGSSVGLCVAFDYKKSDDGYGFIVRIEVTTSGQVRNITQSLAYSTALLRVTELAAQIQCDLDEFNIVIPDPETK